MTNTSTVCILHIETSTTVCSVALSKDRNAYLHRVASEPNAHASDLTLLIAAMMEEAELRYDDLSAVSVAMGPGSYTGLRIGVSTAKGICYATGLPLIGINSLEALGYAYRNAYVDKYLTYEEELFLSPMIDARRMEVYRAIYDANSMNEVRATEAVIMDETSFDFLKPSQKVQLFGTGAEKLQEMYASDSRLEIISDVYADAQAQSLLAYRAFLDQRFEDLAYFEPYYLKDFIPTKPKTPR